jgi:hypothetical protein
LKEGIDSLHVILSMQTSKSAALREASMKCRLKVTSQSRAKGPNSKDSGLVQSTWFSQEFQLAAEGGIRFQMPGLGAEAASFSMGLEVICKETVLSISPPLFVL